MFEVIFASPLNYLFDLKKTIRPPPIWYMVIDLVIGERQDLFTNFLAVQNIFMQKRKWHHFWPGDGGGGIF